MGVKLSCLIPTSLPGIHMQKFPLRGLRQPDVIKSLVYNRRTYLFVVDEGAMSSYSTASHSIQWDEGERAKVVSYRKSSGLGAHEDPD